MLSDRIDFIEVLRCFIFLLKRLEASFWTDEAPEYPLVVFDAVKNNPAFGKLIQSVPDAKQPEEKLWYLSWIHEYFYSVQKLEAIHETVVAKVSDFLLEELQHERFGEARPLVLESAARVSSCVPVSLCCVSLVSCTVSLVDPFKGGPQSNPPFG